MKNSVSSLSAKLAFVVDPAIGSALTVNWLFEGKPSAEFIVPLQNQVTNALTSTDNKFIERALYSQSLTLQALFNRWITAAACSSDPEVVDRLASLALRSQDQCRKTLVSLNEVRNPKRSQFIRNLQLQLNELRLEQNPSAPASNSLEESKNAPVDIGGPRKAGRTDQDLEAVETEHRPKNGRR
jgi:phospholipase/lecithinase/hemolysin